MQLWGSPQKGSGGWAEPHSHSPLGSPSNHSNSHKPSTPPTMPSPSPPLYWLWGASFQTSPGLHLLWEELPAQERHPSWLSTAPHFPPLRFSGCRVSVRAPGCLSGRRVRLSLPPSVRAGHRAEHGQRFLKGLLSLVLPTPPHPPRIAKLLRTLLLS